jgi:hypothetical protein
MGAPASQRRGLAFDDRNTVLQMLLGLVALLPRFDALLAALVPEGGKEAEAGQGAGADAGAEEPLSAEPAPEEARGDALLVEAVLGAIALRVRLGGWIESLPPARIAPDATAGPGSCGPLGELAR